MKRSIKTISVRVDGEIEQAIEKGKKYIKDNSFKVVSNSKFLRDAILAYTSLLERDDDIVQGLNNKDRLKKFSSYMWYLGSRMDIQQSLINLLIVNSNISPKARGKQLWARINDESTRNSVPEELRFKNESACVQYYMNQYLKLLQNDHSSIMLAKKFAHCLEEPDEVEKMDDLEFYKQSKLQMSNQPNKLDEIEKKKDIIPTDLPYAKDINILNEPIDDDGPTTLTEDEARAVLRELYPDELAFEDPIQNKPNN